MNTPDDPERSRIEREIEILGLKREAAEAAGGEMTVWEADDAPPEVLEPFWESVAAYEKAPWTTHFDQLVRAGTVLPAPEEVSDERLPGLLRDLGHRLAA